MDMVIVGSARPFKTKQSIAKRLYLFSLLVTLPFAPDFSSGTGKTNFARLGTARVLEELRECRGF